MNNYHISKQIHNIAWSDTIYFKLDKLFFEKGENVLELSSGTNLLAPPKCYRNSFRRGSELKEPVNVYTSPLGDTKLRNSLKLYESFVLGNETFLKNDLCITSGAADALRLVFKFIQERGAKSVLVLGLQYPIVFQNILNNKMHFRLMLGDDDTGFLPNISEVEKYIEDFDCIFITQPNNPSGEIYSSEELHKLLDLVVKLDKYFVYEKIGFDLNFNKNNLIQDYSALASYLSTDKIFIIDSFSKRRPVSGLRLGYIIGSNKFINRYIVEERFGDCPPLLGVSGAIEDTLCSSIVYAKDNNIDIEESPYYKFLETHVKEILENDMNIYRKEIDGLYNEINSNIDYLFTALGKSIVSSTRLMGGINFLIKLEKIKALDELSFSEKLYNEVKLASYPIGCFILDESLSKDLGNDGIWIRLSPAMPKEDFQNIIKILSHFLKERSEGM